ncbi:SCO2400 family protein [Streptomyces sp. NBC_01217]|uniref:SCO2400 family protein n=1 Tax=Streptomyces sp. NBC_01217 TaxID=2903779 RepID=UPI003FA38D53
MSGRCRPGAGNVHASITSSARHVRQVALALPGAPIPRAKPNKARTERSQMDYCSSCRRTLNGALVCPGCGECAPDIAPPARHRTPWGNAAAMGEARPGEGTFSTTTWDAFAPTEGRHAADDADVPPAGDGGAARGTTTQAAGAGPAGGYEGASPTGEGRAARRRQLARWKKHKRRAAAGAAFAIAGGALTVALMPDRPSASQTQAAAAPDSQRHAPTRLAATDAGSQQPESADTHPTDTRAPIAAGGQQHITAPTAPTHRQPEPAAASRARTSPGSAPHTAPAQGTTAHTGGTVTDTAPAPETSAPPSAEPSDAGTPPAAQEPAPPAAQPAGPPQLCVLGVVCIG